MQRPIIYSLEQIRAFDTLNGWRDTLYGLGYLSQNMLGNAVTGVIAGFLASQTSSPSLTINLTQGWIYELADVDATVYGALQPDTTQIMQQGYAPATAQTFTVAGISSGQQQWALVQMTFAQQDVIRSGDPNAGILPYINVANPSQPFQGQNNSNVPQNTEREGVCVIDIKYGTAAATGTAVPPTPDAGFLPFVLVLLSFSQSTITNGQILLAGPGAYSGYQSAPYFPGVIGQIPGGSGSHHGGIAGQAQKIVLTAGAEVQGIAAYTNLPVSNTNPNTVAGIVTTAQDIPVLGICNANPNGSVRGNVNDLIFSTLTNQMFICTVSGTSTTAVWVANGYGGISYYINTFPDSSILGGNNYYQYDTTGGAGTANLPAAASMGGTGVIIQNIGTNLLTITPNGAETISGLSSFGLLAGNSIILSSRAGVGWYFASPSGNFNLVAKSASFTASAPSGSLYQMSLTAAINVTLPLSPADGTKLTFQITPTSGTFGVTYLTTSTDTIINGGSVSGPGSTNPLTQPTWRVGVITMTAIVGGWLVV